MGPKCIILPGHAQVPAVGGSRARCVPHWHLSPRSQLPPSLSGPARPKGTGHCRPGDPAPPAPSQGTSQNLELPPAGLRVLVSTESWGERESQETARGQFPTAPGCYHEGQVCAGPAAPTLQHVTVGVSGAMDTDGQRCTLERIQKSGACPPRPPDRVRTPRKHR